jgi:ferredoxin
MRFEVDKSKCVGLGLCEAASPNHFEVGNDGKLIVVQDTVANSELAEAEEAVRSCPTNALKLIP